MDAQTQDIVYRQSGVIPFRLVENCLEILLVTNKKKDKWGIPKGMVESTLSPSESARKEAFEEAGVYGSVRKPSLGKYSKKKWDGRCSVKVFAMEVTQVLANYPESVLRRREWHSPEDAAKMVKNKKLKSMILGLGEFLEVLDGNKVSG